MNDINGIDSQNDTKDPNSYRSICIKNPILKSFCHILAKRISKFSEERSLLFAIQFAFRINNSTIGAIFLLEQAIKSRLNRKDEKSMRMYAVYTDFRKCFDSVNRQKLFKHLMEIVVSQKLYIMIVLI